MCFYLVLLCVYAEFSMMDEFCCSHGLLTFLIGSFRRSERIFFLEDFCDGGTISAFILWPFKFDSSPMNFVNRCNIDFFILITKAMREKSKFESSIFRQRLQMKDSIRDLGELDCC